MNPLNMRTVKLITSDEPGLKKHALSQHCDILRY